MKKKLTKKERWEVGIVLGAVFLVAVVGVGLHFTQGGKLEAIAGTAIDPNTPTYPGILVLLRDYCGPVSGTGNCNDICEAGDKICFPIYEEDCGMVGAGNCLCCSLP